MKCPVHKEGRNAHCFESHAKTSGARLGAEFAHRTQISEDLKKKLEAATLKCEFDGFTDDECKVHSSSRCERYAGHCKVTHTQEEPEDFKEPDDLDIEGAWLLSGIRVVNSSAIKKRIDSEGRWGFLVGLLAGLFVALLVHFVEV